MLRLKDFLKQAYLAKKTIENYNEEREHIIGCSENMMHNLSMSRLLKQRDITVCQIIPSILELGVVAYGLIDRNPSSLYALGLIETGRWVLNLTVLGIYSGEKVRRKYEQQAMERYSPKNDSLEDIIY